MKRTVPKLQKNRSRRLLKLDRLMRKASRMNIENEHRNGSLIELPIKGELMVTGDLHGNHENFDRIVAIAALDRNPMRHLLLQEIVHNIDPLAASRDTSGKLLERVAELKIAHPHRVHVLPGNHELAELYGRDVFKEGRCLNALFARGVQTLYGGDADRAIAAYRRFYRSMPLAVRTTTGIFLSHSTPEARHVERYSLDLFRSILPANFRDHREVIEDLVWGRDFASETAEAFAQRVQAEVLVVGHEPCENGYRVPNHRHVILDSKDANGCFLLIKLNQPYSQKGVVSKISRLQP